MMLRLFDQLYYFQSIMQAEVQQTMDQYKIGKYIFEGATAKLYKAVDKHNKQVAIKAYLTKNFAYFQNQRKILPNLQHPNIVSYKDAKEAAEHKIQSGRKQKIPIIVLQYVDGLELFDYINITTKFPEKIARYYFADMINVLSYMNKKNYAHLGMKIQNILLTNKCILKLIDFGLASPIKGVDFSKHKIDSERYMAPEIGCGNFDPIKADIFSAGVILFFMCTAQFPFKSTNNDPKYQIIKQGKYQNFWPQFQSHGLSAEFKILFQKLVTYDPTKRLTLQQICEDPWMKKDYAKIQEIHNQFKKKIQEKKRQSQKKKKKLQQSHRNRQNNGGSTRGSELDYKFDKIYEQQQRANPVLADIGDLGKQGFYINLEKNFALANLKSYLQEVEIKIREIDPESLVQQNIPAYKLKSMIVQNQQNYELIVTLSCTDIIKYDSEDKQGWDITIQQKLVARIQIGQNAKGQIGFKFKLEQGNYIVYKKFIYDLKAQFLDCMIEKN